MNSRGSLYRQKDWNWSYGGLLVSSVTFGLRQPATFGKFRIQSDPPSFLPEVGWVLYSSAANIESGPMEISRGHAQQGCLDADTIF